MQSRV
jgi:hypothetical protein